MEDFVPFELAVKLKEKGFKELCLAYYDVLDNVGILYNTQYTDDFSPCQYTDLLFSHNSGEGKQTDDSEYCVDAPTISQVLKWLRKEKDMYIEIFLYNGTYSYIVKSITKISEDDYFHQCLNEDTTDMEYENYEDATLAGIEYALDNLI